MKLYKRFFPEIVFFPVLYIAFLFTRLYNILSLPIFTDEAIYSRWSQIALHDPNWRFISLTDGKQPSFVWLDMIAQKFIHDPLLAGRLVSVGAGFLTFVGIYFLTVEIFRNNDKSSKAARIMGLISVLIFVFYPFSLVYDRLAIYDSLVAAFLVWSLYFQIFLVRKLRLDISMITGFVLGGAILTKSTGFLSIYLTPFLLVIFDFAKKNLKVRFLKFIVLSIVSIIIAYAMYSILRLSPFYHIINDKNAVFIYPVGEWLKFSLDAKVHNFLSNFSGLFNWFYIYFSVPYIILVVAAFFINLKFLREKILLLLWFVLPFLALCIFGKTLYPRYLLFMTMSLIPLVSSSLFEISIRLKKVWLIVALFFIVLFLPIRADFYILTNFAKAPIPKSELDQYINGWPSGGGIKESVGFFRDEAQKGPIYIATEGTFGLMPYSYELYLNENPNITIQGLWPIESDIPQDLVEKSKRMSVFVVFYQPCPSCSNNGVAPVSWPLTLVKSYKKGIGENVLNVYKVKSL
jgi:4-amino-4-deoxy-L-arabinose transferase-like glycosyltransferase